MKTHHQEKLLENSFYVKEKNKVMKLNLDDIIALESKFHQVIIYTVETEINLYLTLNKMKRLLIDKKEFIQVHRSYIVSENYIRSIEGNMIKLTNDIKIPIGRLYKKAFEEMIKAKLLR